MGSHIGGPHACYYYYFHDNLNHYLNYNFNHYLHDNFYHHFNHYFHDNKYYHHYDNYNNDHYDNYNNDHDNFHHNSTFSKAQKEKVDVSIFSELIYVELYTQSLHLILF